MLFPDPQSESSIKDFLFGTKRDEKFEPATGLNFKNLPYI